MRRLTLLVLVAGALALLPATVNAGELGACFFIEPDRAAEGGGLFLDVDAFCVDGISLEACDDIFNGEWEADLVCDALDFIWDGACLIDPDGPVGEICVQLFDPGAEAACDLVDGIWFDDPDLCGIPVPAVPAVGLAFLALVLLAGTLGVLTFRS